MGYDKYTYSDCTKKFSILLGTNTIDIPWVFCHCWQELLHNCKNYSKEYVYLKFEEHGDV